MRTSPRQSKASSLRSDMTSIRLSTLTVRTVTTGNQATNEQKEIQIASRRATGSHFSSRRNGSQKALATNSERITPQVLVFLQLAMHCGALSITKQQATKTTMSKATSMQQGVEEAFYYWLEQRLAALTSTTTQSASAAYTPSQLEGVR
jgi:hypothetical protein